MILETWPPTAGARTKPRPAALFIAVLVTAASASCAPPAATAPLPVVAPTAPTAAQSKPLPGPTPCARPTTKDQDLAAAHAAVREALVSNKKKVIEAGRTRSVMHRGPSPEDAENVDEAKKAAAEKAEEAENAKFDAALAAVDVAESQGKGTASDEAKRMELGGEAVAYFFTGSIPNTCECGSGYDPGWGILVLKDGCAWRRVGGDFTGETPETLRAPNGSLVFVQINPGDSGDGCAGGAVGETRLLLVQSKTEVQALRIPGVPAAQEKDSVCGHPRDRAELQREQGTLIGARLFSNTADTNDGEPKWTPRGSIVFEKGEYVERPAGR